MYTVELDLHLIFTPPMSEEGNGIVVTRSFELPFVPLEGMLIYSAKWESDPEPNGFALKNICWDVDRRLFLATATMIHVDSPFPEIGHMVQDWIGHGWRLGSFLDHYQKDRDDAAGNSRDGSEFPDLADSSSPEFETLHLLAPQKRPKLFNEFFKSLIRAMSDSPGDWAIAYAMDMTGTYIGQKAENRPWDRQDEAVQTWLRHVHDWRKMSGAEMVDWTEKVRNYPKLEDLLIKKKLTATNTQGRSK